MTHTATDFQLLLAWWTRFLHNSSTPMLSRCRPRPQGRSNQRLASEGFNRRGSVCVVCFFLGGKRDQKGRGIEYDGRETYASIYLKARMHTHTPHACNAITALVKPNEQDAQRSLRAQHPPPSIMSLCTAVLWILLKKNRTFNAAALQYPPKEP